MAYEQTQTIDPSVQPFLQSYDQAAKDGYAQDMGQLRGTAVRELDAELANQGTQGRAAGYQQQALDQQFRDEQNRFNTGLGLQEAQLGEELRQQEQQRSWAVQDRDLRLARLKNFAAQQRQNEQDAEKGGLMGEIGGGVGSVLGGLVGGYYGGPTGAMLGAGAGGAVGGAAGSAF